MKIHAITEFKKPFVYLTTGLAYKALEQLIPDSKVILTDYKNWHSYVTSHDMDMSDIDILIFEAAYGQVCNVDILDLRKFYKNAKIVCLGSDSIFFVTTGKNDGYQFQNVHLVDLFLEKMSDCIEFYKKRKMNVDHWMWTASGELLDYVRKFGEKSFHDRMYDFIGLYAPHSIDINRRSSYRYDMITYINKSHQFIRGGKNFGQNEDRNNVYFDPDVDIVFENYGNSKFTLGTTSHDDERFHGMKGFRDWIGPEMGAILIYDDYKDIVKYYDGGALVPLYGYGKFEEILEIASYFSNNNTHREILLQKQQEWARKNTIEKQLHRLFLKHNII